MLAKIARLPSTLSIQLLGRATRRHVNIIEGVKERHVNIIERNLMKLGEGHIMDEDTTMRSRRLILTGEHAHFNRLRASLHGAYITAVNSWLGENGWIAADSDFLDSIDHALLGIMARRRVKDKAEKEELDKLDLSKASDKASDAPDVNVSMEPAHPDVMTPQTAETHAGSPWQGPVKRQAVEKNARSRTSFSNISYQVYGEGPRTFYLFGRGTIRRLVAALYEIGFQFGDGIRQDAINFGSFIFDGIGSSEAQQIRQRLAAPWLVNSKLYAVGALYQARTTLIAGFEAVLLTDSIGDNYFASNPRGIPIIAHCADKAHYIPLVNFEPGDWVSLAMRPVKDFTGSAPKEMYFDMLKIAIPTPPKS